MRNLIEYRLDYIKDHHSGFPKDTMRWRNFFVDVSEDERVHISQIQWENLDDEELLSLFERLVRQMSKVM